MIICDHGIDPKNCPMCKKVLAKATDQLAAPPHPLSGPAPQPTEALTEKPLVHIPNTPEITDPQAKNVLQLAQEYAQAQNDVGNLRTETANLHRQLRESEKKLADALENCDRKQRELARAVTPVMVTTCTAAAVRTHDNQE